MSARLRRLLLPLLRAAAKGGVITFRMKSAAQQGLFLLGKATSKSKGGRLRREEKRAAHNQTTAEIRAAVMLRADGSCECLCGRIFAPGVGALSAELDHWASGSGRRRQQQSVQNTWALARWCHWRRTHNQPSVAYWNDRFAEHAAKHFYPPIAHITHAQLKRSAP